MTLFGVRSCKLQGDVIILVSGLGRALAVSTGFQVDGQRSTSGGRVSQAEHSNQRLPAAPMSNYHSRLPLVSGPSGGLATEMSRQLSAASAVDLSAKDRVRV